MYQYYEYQSKLIITKFHVKNLCLLCYWYCNIFFAIINQAATNNHNIICIIEFSANNLRLL